MAEEKKIYIPAAKKGEGISRFLSGFDLHDISWKPFIVLGVLFSILVGIAISINPGQYFPYIVGGIGGIIVFVLIFQKPEFGIYILIFSVFANISDILTDKGLPSVNRPLLAITLASIIANYLLKTGKFDKFPIIGRTEWAMLAFYSVIVVSTFVSPDKSQVISIIVDITKDILVGVALYIGLNSKDKWEASAWILIGTIGFLSLLGVFKELSGTDLTFFNLARQSIFGQVGSGDELRYAGPIGESNLWGQVLVAALPLVIYRLYRKHTPFLQVVIAIVTLLIFLAAIFTGSRGAFVALIVVAPVIALEMRIKPLPALSAILAAIIIFSILPTTYAQRFQSLNVFLQTSNPNAVTQDASFAGRSNEIRAGLAMFMDHPFLGVGFGNYGANYWDYAGKLGLISGESRFNTSGSTKYAHSLYIEVISETGILGLTAFLLFFGLLFLDLFKIRKRYKTYHTDPDWETWVTSLIISIFTFLVSGIFLHGLLFRYIWMLVGLALAAISISNETHKTFISAVQKKP
ncbi:O-antigen ligase family protein [Candidatus Villigracilis saccharophilus]|uniref:O-antigen ligase family protein n=1 Tax=Candidatus Villigracilis saccharophilus TaxID=3140684 RepID=UPI003135EBC8|nr:O-antigen ligase family protein [Anaerolineales bacterium]